ncbi:response regulator transcription factor [Hirschia litorea]|uniref:Response regulator transcription factor n=1 Tax=Hirschia litorea TaxID=1199156 RepID=A0ABW2IMX1_9PROT
MSQLKTILIVDDDNDLREALAEQFERHEGFAILQAPNATEGMNIAEAEKPDLVILDVEMPDMDGRDACKLMRKHGLRVPVIMLTGQDSDADMVLGLDSGANDYVAKPFKFTVLLARVRAHLRTFEQSEDATFKIGPYEFRPSTKSLIDEAGKKIRLTEKETNILKYLYRAEGKAVARDELLSEVWGYNANVTTHTLETHIYRLRQKIEPDPAHAHLLITETGGYRIQL